MNAFLTQDRIEARRSFDHQAEIEREKWVDDRASEIIALFPKTPAQLVTFSIPPANKPYAGLSHDNASETYNDFVTAVAYAQADYEWEHRTGCPF